MGFLELLDDIEVKPHAQIANLGQSVPSEDGHDAGKTKNKSRLKPDLGMTTEEDLESAIHQSEELGQHSGRRRPLL